MKNIKSTICVLLIMLVIPLAGCREQKQTDTFYAMGSFVSQTVYGADDMLLENVKSNILKADELISHKNQDSKLSLLNKEKTAVFDTTIYDILYNAVDFCADSEGVFDISLLSVTALWDFDSENPSIPREEDVQAALRKTGYQNILFGENNTVTLKNGVSLDLGALGKGYACDIAVEHYKKSGVSGIVAVGGSIGVNGTKPGDEPFNVGIRNPFSENSSDVFASIVLKSGFISTSGSYEKYFVQDGVLYHHILDTKTGYPVETDIVSVSVVCDSGMNSDMLSTACFILGIEKSKPLLEKYNAEAVFVKKDKQVYITEELRDLVTLYENYEVLYI
jgi:thiamine biosynthesis lipoprotein